MTSKNKDDIKNDLKNGKLMLVSARALLEKSPYAHAFNVAKSVHDEAMVEDWFTCISCHDWLNVPKKIGTNPLKRHIEKCNFDGYAFLDSTNLAKLVGNCLRIGGLKVNTIDLKKTFDAYPVITKTAVDDVTSDICALIHNKPIRTGQSENPKIKNIAKNGITDNKILDVPSEASQQTQCSDGEPNVHECSGSDGSILVEKSENLILHQKIQQIEQDEITGNKTLDVPSEASQQTQCSDDEPNVHECSGSTASAYDENLHESIPAKRKISPDKVLSKAKKVKVVLERLVFDDKQATTNEVVKKQAKEKTEVKRVRKLRSAKSQPKI